MNILIYGAGVQGQYLAYVLNQPENNITLLARGQNYNHLNNRGVVLNHYLQNKRTTDHFNYVSNLGKNDNYDVIFVTMKYSDFYSVVPSLAQNISTNIIFIGNNTNPHKLRQTVIQQSITSKNISFGFLMTGGNRTDSETTVIRFNAGELKVSNLNGVIPFHNKLDEIFKNSSIKLTYETKFEDWLMSHAAMIIPLNTGLSLKNKYKGNQKQLISNIIRSYNELHLLIEHSNYNITPKLQSILFKKFKYIAYPLLKLIINIKMMNQIQGSNSEVNTLYEDIKLLNKQTALTTNHLDDLIKESI
ncbi:MULTISPECIES: ketopantoate reductase family protein [Staphylococcus]|uniref:ketopantoate reductase family protein n=1 Tax=Staphylococcus TaxID=1279 RepID=UPI000C328E90|nr:2-dehydropantoate 2-reductase N-terminal domain-containing protein [Staphylococcus shinii]MDW8564499.1 2-dehydropantoate 2-reductase N-terminal domain-containing protein [Staphylococcus shinii]MEC5300644.1 ketopantoate reductase family protein [Staphylococcus shinii]PKI08546.1 ACP synthase [Staphylococcus shinii]RIN06101.1 ketopantoate reductase family protein [Staphylococcus shinii]